MTRRIRRLICKNIWEIWLGTGLCIELYGFHRGCHETFSRRSGTRYTPYKRCKWSLLFWPLLGAGFAWHLTTLKELPAEEPAR